MPFERHQIADGQDDVSRQTEAPTRRLAILRLEQIEVDTVAKTAAFRRRRRAREASASRRSTPVIVAAACCAAQMICRRTTGNFGKTLRSVPRAVTTNGISKSRASIAAATPSG